MGGARSGNLETVLAWIPRRPLLAGTLTGLYFTFTVLTHDHVQGLIQWVQARVPGPLYNGVITGIALVISLGVFSWAVRSTRGDPRRGTKGIWGLILALVLVLCYQILIAVNSEAIHFIQYAPIGAVLYLLSGRALDAAIWVILLGAVDEGYQFWILHAHRSVYLDFNDIILILAGGMAGIVLLAIRLPASTPSAAAPRRRRLSPALTALAALLLAAGIAVETNALAVDYQPRGTHRVALTRTPGTNRKWSRPSWANKTYYVLHPYQGMAALLGLLVAVTPLDRSLGFPAARCGRMPADNRGGRT